MGEARKNKGRSLTCGSWNTNKRWLDQYTNIQITQRSNAEEKRKSKLSINMKLSSTFTSNWLMKTEKKNNQQGNITLREQLFQNDQCQSFLILILIFWEACKPVLSFWKAVWPKGIITWKWNCPSQRFWHFLCTINTYKKL